MIRQLKHSWKTMLAIAITATQLTACGGGSSGSGSASESVVISGSVGDGPITGATVTTYNAMGDQLTSVVSDIYAIYRSTIKLKGREYPLTMEVSGGIDLVTGAVPDFTLYSVAMSRDEKSVNINPFTTMAVMMARLMPGGVNKDNIDTAMNHVTGQLGFGFDMKVIKDPRTARVTDNNVANIVKASEAMGEMVRRTRDTITTTGTFVTGDDVMYALAADMVDGFMDGAGAAGTDGLISAVANVVSGQVLVEALSNNLKVGGVIATGLIDQAIRLTHIDINSDQMTDSVRITDGMLEQTRVALAAARMVDSSKEVIDIANGLGGVSVNSLPGEVASHLSADSSAALANAVFLSSTASEAEAASINQAVHADGTAGDTGNSGSAGSGGTGTGDTGGNGTGSTGGADTGGTSGGAGAGTDGGTTGGSASGGTGGGTSEPKNNSPVISGTPASSVSANDNYSFQPTASDADGNVLAFSISNKPGWAGFSDATGRLSGTPTNANAGLYDNIVISVSDGLVSTSLPAFSVRVDAVVVPTGSFTLDWTAPVARTDGTALSLADIDGYRIYYGTSSGNYPNMVNVADGSAQGATVTDVTTGNYYIVMTTYDTNGLESGYSSEIIKPAQ